MQILRPQPRPAESGTLGQCQGTGVFTSSSDNSDAHLSLGSTGLEMGPWNTGVFGSKHMAPSKLIRTKNWLFLLELNFHCKTEAKWKNIRSKQLREQGLSLSFGPFAKSFWMHSSPNLKIPSSGKPSEAIPRKILPPCVPRVQNVGVYFDQHLTVVYELVWSSLPLDMCHPVWQPPATRGY